MYGIFKTFCRCTECGLEFYEEDATVIRNYGHEPDELGCPMCGGVFEDIEEEEVDLVKTIKEIGTLALMARRA